MKRTKPLLLSLLMLFILIATPCHADAASNESVTHYDDGCYAVTTIIDEPTLQPLPGAQTNATMTSTTKSKITYFCTASDEVMWYLKVTGSFTYSKDTAACHGSSVKAESCNSTWKISNRSAARGSVTAYASATAKQYMVGVLMKTMDELISLTCHPGGTFS